MNIIHKIFLSVLLCVGLTGAREVSGAVGAPTAKFPEQSFVDGTTAFALDLYHQLRKDESNLFFSPYSMYGALLMAAEGARGDTATNVTKPVKIETGAEIVCPAFINTGDVIKVDTRTGQYVERVKT